MGPRGTFEDGGEGTEIGVHRQQPIHPVGQCGHRRVTHERHLAGSRFDNCQRQRVDVTLRADLLTEGPLGRRIGRQIDRGLCTVSPDDLGDHPGKPGVTYPQPAVVAEDQRRRADVTVELVRPVERIEPLARLETHHQSLRRGEHPATVQQVTEAATTKVFAGDEQHRPAVPHVGAVVQDPSQVGVMQLGGLAHDLGEPQPERLVLTDGGVHQLEHHRLIGLLVKPFERGDLKAGSPPGAHHETAGQSTSRGV